MVSSRIFISLVASPSRRHSGATVTAVTWPCHSLPSPSAFPNTALINLCLRLQFTRLLYTQPESALLQPARQRTICHGVLPQSHLAVLGPSGQVFQIELKVVLHPVTTFRSPVWMALVPSFCEKQRTVSVKGSKLMELKVSRSLQLNLLKVVISAMANWFQSVVVSAQRWQSLEAAANLACDTKKLKRSEHATQLSADTHHLFIQSATCDSLACVNCAQRVDMYHVLPHLQPS